MLDVHDFEKNINPDVNIPIARCAIPFNVRLSHMRGVRLSSRCHTQDVVGYLAFWRKAALFDVHVHHITSSIRFHQQRFAARRLAVLVTASLGATERRDLSRARARVFV